MQSSVMQRSQEEESMSTVAHQLNKELATMAESASRALVEVRLGGRRGGAGAGIIWHPQGLIVTNAHVASGGSMRVTLPSGATCRPSHPATVVTVRCPSARTPWSTQASSVRVSPSCTSSSRIDTCGYSSCAAS